MAQSHGVIEPPSAWVSRWGSTVSRGGRVLDVACGQGRHALWFASRGHTVDAVDRNADALATLSGVPNVVPLCADLEREGSVWPYLESSKAYGCVVITNYLHRPLLPALLDALGPGGVLIYETFALGNERFGRPSNPDFLLRPGELLELVRGRLFVQAYEDLIVDFPRPARVQRICAVHETNVV